MHSHSVTSQFTLSLASLGTQLTSGALRVGGSEFCFVPPRHRVSTWTQEGGIVLQSFPLNTLCAPEQVTIFPVLFLKWILCCYNAIALELGTSEYNPQVLLININVGVNKTIVLKKKILHQIWITISSAGG